MSKLFRPMILLPAWVALTLVALILVLRPTWEGAPVTRPVPRPVPAGDQEVVWLNAATNVVAWERFVAAVHKLAEDPNFGMQVADDQNAFPSQTTAVPELAVRMRGSKGLLWFRWYKLTGDLGSGQWVQALAQRQPPPLAIIGGGSSDRARDLARELNDLRPAVSNPPLLLITTATADQVELEHEMRDLMKIYAERSFRFCFTNQQMAAATADFIWSQDDLRPDAEPVYLVVWKDDPYSKDLFERFRHVLNSEGYIEQLRRQRLARLAARDWAWLAGYCCLGGIPPGLEFEGLRRDEFDMPPPFWSADIPYSVGSFAQPNHWEAGAAEKMLNQLNQRPGQRRPLLILPAIPQPARRFLRAVVRTSPVEAGQFVVATGDALDFNSVYRDRQVTWPIQDLPFALVLFCHRNPVDAVAFKPDHPDDNAPPDPAGRTPTGTQDLLLYRDIVEAIVEAAYQDGQLLTHADALGRNLRVLEGTDGKRRFDDQGNPFSGHGEYVVCLRPVRDGDRVLPRAILQVWNRSTGTDGARAWVRVPVAGQAELSLDYSQTR